MKDLTQRLKKLENEQKYKTKFNNVETIYYKDGRIERVNRYRIFRKVIMEFKEIDHIEPSFSLLNAFLGGKE